MEKERTPVKPADKKTALAKAESFCAYQERSQQEVRDKLYSLGLHSGEVEELIAELIENNFLNEKRFAFAYAEGKFRMKQWGKLKIAAGLKTKRVTPKLIAEAQAAIDPEEYFTTLRSLLEKKALIIKESDTFKRKQKLVQYALSKGYENDLIFDALKSSSLI